MPIFPSARNAAPLRASRPVGAVIAAATLALGGMLATAAPAAANTASVKSVAPGDTVGDFQFSINEMDATATVTAYVGHAADVTIPATVTIGGIEHTVTEIGAYAFSEKGLQNVEFPNTIRTVEEGAFMLNQLSSVTIPDSVVRIADEAFSMNPVVQVTLGASVQEMGVFAFEHFDDANWVVLPLEVVFTGPPPTTFAGVTPTTFSGSFAESDNVTISYPKEYDADVYPGGFTRPTWHGYTTQGTVTVEFDLGRAGGSMPAVRAAEGTPFTAPSAPVREGFDFVGWYVDEALRSPFDESAPIADDLVLYAGWDLLELLRFEGVGPVYYMVDVHADNPTASAVGTTNSFHGTELTILPEVEIEGIVYPVTSIGPYSFDGLGITKVILPDSIVTIEEYAFAAGDVRDNVLTHRNPLGDLIIPDSVKTIERYAFAGATLTSLQLGSGVRHIDEAAFIDTSLTALTLPESLLTIDQFAFDENALRDIVIPDSVTDIGMMAFGGSPLATVRIGAGIQSIGVLAFSSATHLARAAVIDPMVVTFIGAPPSTFHPAGYSGSFGLADGVLVQYPVAFDETRHSGGFSSPTWQGYETAALATITFELQGRGTTIAPMTVSTGAVLKSLPIPTAAGWTFTGWYTDAATSFAFDAAQPVATDLTLYAGWQQVVVPGRNDPTSNTGDATNGPQELAVTGAESPTPFTALAASLLLLGMAALIRARRGARPGAQG